MDRVRSLVARVTWSLMESKEHGNRSEPHSSRQNDTADTAEQSQSGASARSARYIALAEQALISGSNFLLYIYAARMLPKEQWGALSFALASLQVLQGFQRAFVTVPMMTSGDKQGVFRRSLSFWSQMQGWVTGITLVLIISIYLVAYYLLEPWVSSSLLLVAVLLAPWYYMEYARRVVIMSYSMYRLLLMAIAYALIFLIAGAGAYSIGYKWGLSSFAILMACAAVVSTLFARVRLWPVAGRGEVNNDGGSWSIASLWRFGRWAAASSLAYSGYTFAIQAILAAIGGPATLGIYTAARNLIQPVNTLIQAIDSVDKPRAGWAYSQRGMSGLWQVIRRSWAWLLIIALPYLGMIGLFSETLLGFFYGEKYADASAPVQFWCLAILAMILVQPLETGLYVLRRPDWLFYGRAVSAGLVIMLTPWLVTHWMVNGALIALVIGWGLAGVSAAWLLRKVPDQGATS